MLPLYLLKEEASSVDYQLLPVPRITEMRSPCQSSCYLIQLYSSQLEPIYSRQYLHNSVAHLTVNKEVPSSNLPSPNLSIKRNNKILDSTDSMPILPEDNSFYILKPHWQNIVQKGIQFHFSYRKDKGRKKKDGNRRKRGLGPSKIDEKEGTAKHPRLSQQIVSVYKAYCGL
ncbi:hypothetical protein SCA6_013897 [Theobroma cacao]